MLDRGLVTRVVIQRQQQQQEQQQEQGQEQGQEQEEERDQDQTPSLPNHGQDGSTKEGATDDAATAAAAVQGSRPQAHEGSANAGYQHPDPPSNDDDAIKAPEQRAKNTVYYVRSAAAAAATTSGRRAGRNRSAGLERKSYEVRLRAWNCSCPAFTFSAFGTAAAPALSVGSARGAPREVDGGDDGVEAGDGRGVVEDRSGGEGEMDGEEGWVFGALSSLWAVGEEVGPVCKHLLACVVGERCGLLSGFVAERVVGRGEGAGLGAGWDG